MAGRVEYSYHYRIRRITHIHNLKTRIMIGDINVIPACRDTARVTGQLAVTDEPGIGGIADVDNRQTCKIVPYVGVITIDVDTPRYTRCIAASSKSGVTGIAYIHNL